VVQAIVSAAREADERGGAAAPRTENLGVPRGQLTVDDVGDHERASGAAGTVPGGAAPPPSGVAPARRSVLHRLDVVVARQLDGGPGQIPPAVLAAARRRIKAGDVVVDGHDGELLPGLLVSAGTVVLRNR
jgi:hypothetical protein